MLPDPAQIATAYSYAATGVLSGMITQDMTNGVTLSQTAYTYYTDGNVHTETDVLANSTTTYTYDANNRLLTETKPGSVKSYTYDANGNMLSGDGATYTYDARDRQSSYVKGTTFAGYTYYPTGLRKTKNSNLAVTNYAWDGSNMVLEYTGSATAGNVYIYGLTLISQGNSWYYIYNAHGDVVKYINSTGIVLKSYDYDAFGEEAAPNSADANPFRYAGQYFDSETGTYYLRARYYSPALGRFTQQDAWGYGDPGDPLSLNLYVYCYGKRFILLF